MTDLQMSIKGNAMNKGKARVWLESSKLAGFGFSRHAPIQVYFHSDRIVVELDPDGDRKVAGRERNGKKISILDICFANDKRAEMFGADVARIAVSVTHGKIVFTRES